MKPKRISSRPRLTTSCSRTATPTSPVAPSTRLARLSFTSSDARNLPLDATDVEATCIASLLTDTLKDSEVLLAVNKVDLMPTCVDTDRLARRLLRRTGERGGW
mgnify:CR=1 FL=1